MQEWKSDPRWKHRNVYAVAGWSHVVPFALWLGLMALLDFLGGPAAWKYALRVLLCGGLLVWLRPWRWYAPPAWRQAPIALLAGLFVFVLWVAPESSLAARWPHLQDVYLKWAVFPLGQISAAKTASPYAPEYAGWFLCLVRLAGSAFVIAVIEEFFWRGFLYRWMLGRSFLDVDAGQKSDVWVVAGLCLAFGLEHDRWLAGALAGYVYLMLYIRTRNLWSAIIAHVATNLLLGLYVLKTGAYSFW